MATITKKLKYTNDLEKTSRNKKDAFQVSARIYVKKLDVTSKWGIKFKFGLNPLHKPNNTTHAITRGNTEKITVDLTPAPDARNVPYTLRTFFYRLEEGEKPGEKEIVQESDMAAVRFTLTEAKMPDLAKIPDDIEDLQKMHSDHAFTSDPYGYLSKFLFEPKTLKFDELIDLKKRVDALYNSLPPEEKSRAEKYYQRINSMYSVIENIVAHQDALKAKVQEIERKMGKWAFKYKGAEPIGLEPETWTDPEYKSRGEEIVKYLNSVRARIMAMLRAANNLYNTIHETSKISETTAKAA